MKQLKSTTVENLELEQEVREYLQIGEEIRADYLATILGLLNPETYLTLTTIVELSKSLTSTKAVWIKPGNKEEDWVKICKDRKLTKVVIHRKGRNNLSFVRDRTRFVVNSI